MQMLLDSLKKYKASAPHAIVYCRSLNTCADLYAHFHYKLDKNSYYPPGADQVSDNRLFAMFHANTVQHNKDMVLKVITQPNGTLRIVFALGMGVNLLNLIIHFGAPQSIDDYFQESGRGGRTGDDAHSIVYRKPIDCPLHKELTSIRDHELAAVRRYLENITACRRK